MVHTLACGLAGWGGWVWPCDVLGGVMPGSDGDE